MHSMHLQKYAKYATIRSKSLSKMLRQVQNEMFTFEIDPENALVGCTLER